MRDNALILCMKQEASCVLTTGRRQELKREFEDNDEDVKYVKGDESRLRVSRDLKLHTCRGFMTA